MDKTIYQRYLETSVYTDVGLYKDFVLSLPDDIPTITFNAQIRFLSKINIWRQKKY